MHIVFQFHGGPMDGNALHYDDSHTYSGDFGAQAYADTDGGAIGRQFTVLNPDGPTDEHGKRRFTRYVYETVSAKKITGKSPKTLIKTRYIRPAD